MSLYSDLGVEKTAGPEDIKRAFRHKAAKEHPDRPGGDTERFQVIQRAYDILGDEEKRRRYDETGQTEERSSIETAAKQQLASLFLQLLKRVPDPSSFDLLAQLHNDIKGGQKSIKQKRTAAETEIKRLEKVLARLKCRSSGVSLLHGALEQQIQQVKNSLADFEQATRLGEEMQKLLEEYEYSFDKPQEVDPFRAFFQTTELGY